MSSASSTAFLIEATVVSILMTTPLRNPRDGLVPIPTISRPTMRFSLLLDMVSPSRSTLFYYYFIAVVKIDIFHCLQLRRQIPVYPRKPGKFLREATVSKFYRNPPLGREQGIPIPLVDMDLGYVFQFEHRPGPQQAGYFKGGFQHAFASLRVLGKIFFRNTRYHGEIQIIPPAERLEVFTF